MSTGAKENTGSDVRAIETYVKAMLYDKDKKYTEAYTALLEELREKFNDTQGSEDVDMQYATLMAWMTIGQEIANNLER